MPKKLYASASSPLAGVVGSSAWIPAISGGGIRRCSWSETLLVIALLAFPCRFPAVERALKRLARHRMAPLAVGALAMLLRGAALPIEPVPQPSIHDEFSHLLAADTFAHGRLSNPTPVLWEHFETFHVNMLPTYATMYPPLPGLVLAAGQVAAGSPFAGVWLSMGLMCAALCWALRGWFPPEWALLGGSIAAIRLGMFSYWDNSYWGGALAAAGGALVFGALPRLRNRSRPRDAAIAALGALILANTRPYEGFVLCVGVASVALWKVGRLRLRSIVPPAAAVLLCGAALMAYYDRRVFGDASTVPYVTNRQTYAMAPYFVFQTPRPEPVFRHEEMREFYARWEMNIFRTAQTPRGFVLLCLNKLALVWSFFLGPVLTLPLLAFFWTLRSPRSRVLLLLAGLSAAATALVPFFMVHYIAPLTVLIYAIVLQGMRALARPWPRVVRAVPLVCIAMVLVRVGMAAASIPLDPEMPLTWARNWPAPIPRAAMEDELRREGGRHLVLVRYPPDYGTGTEWVYNRADIESAPVIRAHDMGAAKNAELIAYYAARKVWILEAGPDAALRPYVP